jgi:3-hydroxybutyryl-CoA dehydratase
MENPVLPKRVLGEPHLGDKAAFRRTITEADVALFIGVTWDVNPLHSDETYASAMPFGRRIVPGLLTASLLTHLGGLWAFLASEMRFEFVAPVFVGDTVTAEGEIVEADQRSGKVILKCVCKNSEGAEVLRGEVRGFPGRFAS